MTSMMNIKYITSMKCMKLMAYFSTYIECKSYVIACSFFLYVIIIISYLRDKDC